MTLYILRLDFFGTHDVKFGPIQPAQIFSIHRIVAFPCDFQHSNSTWCVQLSPISFSTEPAFWGEVPKNITHLTNHLPAASFEGFKENPSFVLGKKFQKDFRRTAIEPRKNAPPFRIKFQCIYMCGDFHNRKFKPALSKFFFSQGIST